MPKGGRHVYQHISAQRRRRGCSIPPEWMLNLCGRGAQSRAEYLIFDPVGLDLLSVKAEQRLVALFYKILYANI